MILRTCSKGGFDGNDEVGFSLDSSCGTLPGETLGDSIGSDGCDGDGLFATKGVNNPLDPAGRYPFRHAVFPNQVGRQELTAGSKFLDFCPRDGAILPAFMDIIPHASHW